MGARLPLSMATTIVAAHRIFQGDCEGFCGISRATTREARLRRHVPGRCRQQPLLAGVVQGLQPWPVAGASLAQRSCLMQVASCPAIVTSKQALVIGGKAAHTGLSALITAITRSPDLHRNRQLGPRGW